MLGVVKQQQQTEIKIWHIWAHKVLNASISMGGKYTGNKQSDNNDQQLECTPSRYLTVSVWTIVYVDTGRQASIWPSLSSPMADGINKFHSRVTSRLWIKLMRKQCDQKKSQNVYKRCPKIISPEKKDFDTYTKFA